MTALAARCAEAVASIRGPVAGILLMMLAACLNVTMTALAKDIMRELPTFEVVFFRHLGAALLMIPFLFRGGNNPFRTTALRMHGLRALLNIGAVLCYFSAVALITLEEVTALNFIAPIVAMVIAVLVLRERMHLARWGGLALGVAGALIIVRPGIQEISLGSLLILCSSTLWGATMICIKVLGRTESATVISFYGSMLQVPVLLVLALVDWQWPSLHQLLILFVMAALGAGGMVALSQAFREADAAVVLPIDFTKLVWASLLGYALFADTPDIWTWAGGATVFSGVLWISYAERGRRRAATEPAIS